MVVGQDLKHNSRALLEGPARAAARAQLKGIGFDDEALAKPIIGVATTWTETMPCNFHHRALAAKAAGRMTDEELHELEGLASPGAGACGGQFTANTMAMAFQLLGISPMGPSDVPAQDPTKAEAAYDAGKLVMDVLARGQRPSEIITKPALENAIAGVAMSGGSTNAVLHLLAVAREAGVELAIDDFDRIAAATPLLCDLKPFGRFVATDLHAAGGTAVVASRLQEAGLLNEDPRTPDGKNVGEHHRAAREKPG